MKLPGAVLLCASLLILLTGCTEVERPPQPAAPAADSPTAFPVERLSDTGSSVVRLEVPDDAGSLSIDFGCAGGEWYTVEFGDSMVLGQSPYTGTCDGLHSWVRPTDGANQVRITVAEGVRWVAQAQFSTEEYVSDPDLLEECEAYSAISSALWNADQGYTSYGAFGADEWTSRVDEAAAALAQARDASRTLLAAPLGDLHATVTAPARTVGESGLGSDAAMALIASICRTNQTPVVHYAEFGG